MRGRTARAFDALRQAKTEMTVRELCRAIGAEDPVDIKHYSTTFMRLYQHGKVERTGPIACSVTQRQSTAYRLKRDRA